MPEDYVRKRKHDKLKQFTKRIGTALYVLYRSSTRPRYREYNPDSAGTRRDECLVGDSRRQVLVDGDKDIEVVQE